VVMELTDSDFLSWIKLVYGEFKIDRVIVHLEQIDPCNQNSKHFSVALGKLLQQHVSDTETCIVKMSQPHIHRATGPVFHLLRETVDILQLQPALFQQRHTRAESNPAVVPVQHDNSESEMSDVEPSDSSSATASRQAKPMEYRLKKEDV